MTFSSPFPDVSIPDVTLFDHLFGDLAPADVGSPALIDGTSGAQTSFGQLRAQILALAGGLAQRGFGPGQVAGVLCPNVPAFVTVLHGILRAGGAATTVNSLYTAAEMTAQLRDARARYLFTISAFLDRTDEAAGLCKIPADRVVVIDGSDTVAPGRTNLRQLLGTRAAAPDLSLDPATTIAVLPYSSGTTAVPKGVLLTHRNLVANIEQFRPLIRIQRTDRVLAVLPFFHIYGLNVLMSGGLVTRAAIVTMPKFDLADFLRVIAEHRTSYLFIAPPVAVALAKHPAVAKTDTSAIRVVFSGAAPLDQQLGEALAARLGCVVRQGYGMTEMSPVSHAIPEDRDDIPLGTVGLTVPNMRCKLVDPATGDEIEVPATGTSAPGELWCAGPNVMTGYLGDARATAETIDADGFLHTGDVATVSAEGYVRIVDRVKELIKYKGYQVPPAELEAVLLTHPGIADAAVVGVLDAEGEEVPKAFVVRQADSAVTADEVMTHVADRVAPHMKVRQVAFVEAIPKSAAGKILRKNLRANQVTHAR